MEKHHGPHRKPRGNERGRRLTIDLLAWAAGVREYFGNCPAAVGGAETGFGNCPAALGGRRLERVLGIVRRPQAALGVVLGSIQEPPRERKTPEVMPSTQSNRGQHGQRGSYT